LLPVLTILLCARIADGPVSSIERATQKSLGLFSFGRRTLQDGPRGLD